MGIQHMKLSLIIIDEFAANFQFINNDFAEMQNMILFNKNFAE